MSYVQSFAGFSSTCLAYRLHQFVSSSQVCKFCKRRLWNIHNENILGWTRLEDVWMFKVTEMWCNTRNWICQVKIDRSAFTPTVGIVWRKLGLVARSNRSHYSTWLWKKLDYIHWNQRARRFVYNVTIGRILIHSLHILRLIHHSISLYC